MRSVRPLARLGVAAAAPATMFAAQTWLIGTGRPEAVLGLAQYGGLLGLIFFAFDGNSGLVPALMRLRHTDATIRSAYRFYRASIAALLAVALPFCWHFAPTETATLLPFVALALLIRLPLLDATLDQRGLHHWSMLLQNVWMLPLAGGAMVLGRTDATLAGHAALWSTIIMAGAHRFFGARPQALGSPTGIKRAVLEIFGFMGAQGLGQIYGRATLFALGTAFTGPAPSLIIYAKQVFNAAGLLVLYLRRVELARGLSSMRLSLLGQAGIAVAGTVFVALAAEKLGIAPILVLALVAWQVLEKLSATAIYVFQTRNRHDLALAGLVVVTALGLAGLALAVDHRTVLFFVGFEALGYCAVLILFGSALRAQYVFRAGAKP